MTSFSSRFGIDEENDDELDGWVDRRLCRIEGAHFKASKLLCFRVMDSVVHYRWGEAITSLGELPYEIDSFATGTNARGQIVGHSLSAPGGFHGVLWQDGTTTDLGASCCQYVTGINERGQVVGSTSLTESGDFHAVLWQDGTITDLGTLPGGIASYATGINNRGQVVGYGDTGSGGIHAVLWQLREH